MSRPSPPIQLDPRALATCRWLSRATGCVALFVGALVIVGWALGVDLLTNLRPGWASMKVNTAVCIALAGLALTSTGGGSHATTGRRLARLCAAMVMAVSALTLAQYLMGTDLGIDLARYVAADNGVAPGPPDPMAPSTAASLFLLGAALISMDGRVGRRLAQPCTLLGGLIPFLALIGYLYDAEALYRFGPYSSMALHTAVMLAAVAVGALCARPDHGVLGIINSDTAGGQMARCLLPAAVAAPLLIGWLSLQGQRAGLFTTGIALGLFALSNIVILAGLIWWIADTLLRLEGFRRETENTLRRVIERVPDVLWSSLNPESEAPRLTFVSPSIRELCGREPESFYEKPGLWLDLAMPEDREEAAAALREVLREKRRVTSRYRMRARSGEIKWVENTMAPTMAGDGAVTGVNGIVRDITEQKRAETQLHKAHSAAAASMKELEKRTAEITRLSQMSELLQSCQTATEAARVVGHVARQYFPEASGALYLLDSSHDSFEDHASWGPSPPDQVVFSPEDCFALRRGRSHFVNAPGSALSCAHLNGSPPARTVCIPMVALSETLGVLHLRSAPLEDSQCELPKIFLSEAEHRLAVTIAEHVALAVGNLRLRESLRSQSIRDPLTDLFNRRYMEEALGRELQRAVRSSRPLSVLLADIDEFKRFNDTFGHDGGDALMRQLGSLFQTQVRSEDIVCRYGGEEFAVILPETPPDIALQRAERLREQVKALQVRHRGRHLGRITLSIGLATLKGDAMTVENLLRAADQALYGAKAQGRDRVVVSDAPAPRPSPPALTKLRAFGP